MNKSNKKTEMEEGQIKFKN